MSPPRSPDQSPARHRNPAEPCWETTRQHAGTIFSGDALGHVLCSSIKGMPCLCGGNSKLTVNQADLKDAAQSILTLEASPGRPIPLGSNAWILLAQWHKVSPSRNHLCLTLEKLYNHVCIIILFMGVFLSFFPFKLMLKSITPSLINSNSASTQTFLKYQAGKMA